MGAIEKKPRLEIYLWRLISLAISMTLNILGDYPQKTQHVPSWAGAALAFFKCKLCWIDVRLYKLGSYAVFFMDWFHKKYSSTSFFSKSMYTAYIIQFVFPISAANKCWILVLQATDNIHNK